MVHKGNGVVKGLVEKVGKHYIHVKCHWYVVQFYKDSRLQKPPTYGYTYEVFTLYEWERRQLFRDDVLVRLQDLAQHGKNAGDMTIEELKALSACLEVAQKARDNRR